MIARGGYAGDPGLPVAKYGDLFVGDLTAGGASGHYMQMAHEVYKTTGKDSALPHPSTDAFTYKEDAVGDPVKIKYADMSEQQKAGFVKAYRDAYREALDDYPEWAILDLEEKEAVLTKAHTYANKVAKAWFSEVYGY